VGPSRQVGPLHGGMVFGSKKEMRGASRQHQEVPLCGAQKSLVTVVHPKTKQEKRLLWGSGGKESYAHTGLLKKRATMVPKVTNPRRRGLFQWWPYAKLRPEPATDYRGNLSAHRGGFRFQGSEEQVQTKFAKDEREADSKKKGGAESGLQREAPPRAERGRRSGAGRMNLIAYREPPMGPLSSRSAALPRSDSLDPDTERSQARIEADRTDCAGKELESDRQASDAATKSKAKRLKGNSHQSNGGK